MSALELLACLLCVAGTLFLTLAVVGTFRRRELPMRVHAAAMSVGPGVLLILAASVGCGEGALVRRALVVALFLLVTAPVSAHAIARAWYLGGRAHGPRNTGGRA